MPRKAPSDPTFHPSRDEPHRIGDTTASGQGVLLDQGESPSRQNLFGGNENRDIGNQSRLRPQWDAEEKYKGTERLLQDVGSQTTVPTTHWTRGAITNPVTGEAERDIYVQPESTEGAGGFYRHEGRGQSKPLIGVDLAGYNNSTETMVHEMGHAHHYETVTNPKERGNPTRLSKPYRDARGFSPDPLKEAVADAYVDRYGGNVSAHVRTAAQHQRNVESWEEMKSTPGFEDMPHAEMDEPDKWSHISSGQFGYSSQYEANRGEEAVWDQADRVLYAGTRAHFSETGDIPRYQWPPGRGMSGSATDATIAHLAEHSPHARAAWEELNVVGPKTEEGHMGTSHSMTDIAESAVRRHKDRKLLSEGQFVQESLFGEPEMARNQQGEVPRTIGDMRASLGTREADYWEMKNKGFKEAGD